MIAFARRSLSRTLLCGAALLGLAGVAGCDKPSPEDCRKALIHMQELLGTENASAAPGAIEPDVRQCTAASTRKSVACAIKATTKEQLLACDFYKAPGATGSAGSAAGSAGSAK